jgi:hypothetical protein
MDVLVFLRGQVSNISLVSRTYENLRDYELVDECEGTVYFEATSSADSEKGANNR